MTWDQRLRDAFDKTGWSAAELHRRSGVSYDNIAKYLKGGVKQPRGDTLDKLADALGIERLYLKEGLDQVISAPLISWVSAGELATPDAVIDLSDARVVTTSDLDPSGDWIALEVEGDSMDRISPPGSTIFVDRSDRRLVPNACYVVTTDRGEATYKRYRPSPDRWEPVSTNPQHEPYFPPHGFGPTIIGRVRKSVLAM